MFFMEMKRGSFINHMIEVLGLDVSTVNKKAIVAEGKLLVKNVDREVTYGDLSYSSDALSLWTFPSR